MKQRFLLGLLCLGMAIGLQAQEGNITVEKVQKSLITKRTATWCPLCGQSQTWPMVRSLNTALEGKALVVAGHHSSSSTLHRDIAEALINNFEAAFGQPIFYFNRERIGGGGSSTESTLNERAETAHQKSPIAQTGLDIRYEEGQRLLQINGRTAFYESTTGNYQLAYYLIRKSVIASQSNQGTDAEHLNVLWDVLTEQTFGVTIDQESLVEGGSFAHQTTYSIPEELNVENLMIAAVIWKDNGDGSYDFVNVEQSDNIQMGLATQTREPIGLEVFDIQPTLTKENSLAVIQLASSLRNSELIIYDASGQKVQTVYEGYLSAGQHRFELQVQTPGTYLVALRVGNRIRTERLIKLR